MALPVLLSFHASTLPCSLEPTTQAPTPAFHPLLAVMLSFGAFPAEVPARVRFLHPLHNFTIVSYEPRQLSEEASQLPMCVGQRAGVFAGLVQAGCAGSLHAQLAWTCGTQLGPLCHCARRCNKFPAATIPLLHRRAASSAPCACRRSRRCAAATAWSSCACPSEPCFCARVCLARCCVLCCFPAVRAGLGSRFTS